MHQQPVSESSGTGWCGAGREQGVETGCGTTRQLDSAGTVGEVGWSCWGGIHSATRVFKPEPAPSHGHKTEWRRETRRGREGVHALPAHGSYDGNIGAMTREDVLREYLRCRL